MKYIPIIILFLSFTGIFYFKESEENLLHIALLTTFLISLIFSYLTKIKEAELKFTTGQSSSILNNYRYHDGGVILLSVCGLIILSFAMYKSFTTNKIDSMVIVQGTFLISIGFMNVSKYFVTIDNKTLKIKGCSYKIKNITEIQIAQNQIYICKSNAKDNFSLGRLSDAEKKEVYEFLLNSSIGDKVSISKETKV